MQLSRRVASTFGLTAGHSQPAAYSRRSGAARRFSKRRIAIGDPESS
jgi:hypothetical protein